jgi:hypothetical protein
MPRAARLLPLALLAVAATALVTPGCGGGGGGGGGAPVPAVSGMVLRYTEEPFADVPLSVLAGGGAGGATRVDGLVLLGPVASGPRVLRVGDSVSTPTLLVPFDVVDGFLARPIYLPSLSSGVGANLPSTVAVLTSVAGPELPAVSLLLGPGTAVGVPSGAAGQVRVLPISPSRFPVALPGAAVARAGFLIEPFGATFAPSATLRIPRLDPAAAGPFDAWQVSPATGQWEPLQTNVPVVGPDGESFDVTVTQGTLVAVAPRAAAPTATLTGRVIAGTQPVAGFRVEVWGKVTDPTGVDGRFTLTGVPTSYGVFYARAYPARPGVDFAPEVTILTATSTNLGDVAVTARSPDAIPPTVRTTSPSDGQLAVEPNAQLVVTFSEPIDRAVPAQPVRVTGRTGEVPARLTFDNAFTVRLIPTQLLELDDQFTVLVDDDVRDLSGNRIDDSRLAFGFATRAGAPAAPPTDTLAFTLSPLTASRGATISVLGRNFTGGTAVTFGATTGLVTAETTDELRALVPDFQPAGDVTVGLSAGGAAVPVLRPLVLDLRAEVAAVLSGSAAPVPLTVVDRARPPLQVIVDGGNIGGTAVTVEGLGIAAVDSTAAVGGGNVATGRTLSIGATPPATFLTGPVVVRGSNGRAAPTYRFMFVREGP